MSISAILLLSCSVATAPRSDQRFAQSPEVRSHDGTLALTLEVVEGASRTPAFSYDGQVGVAPTLRVWPGDNVRIVLRNELPQSPVAINDVNLHFHGMSVTPNAPGDDVIGTVAHPGQTIVYQFRIPMTHPPGLFWYHPHVHGESYWQIESGMSGAIVVEGMDRFLPALRGMKERILILRERMVTPDIALIPTNSRAKYLAYAAANGLSTGASAADPDGDGDGGANSFCKAKPGALITINGQRRVQIPIARGERQFFRVLNASAGRYFDVAIDGGPLGLVALDGFPLATFPGNPPLKNVSHVLIPPGGRAEFIVTGERMARVVRSRCYFSGFAGDPDPLVTLGTLVPGEDEAPSPQPASTDKVVTAPPAIALPAPAATRTIRMTEDARGFYLDGKRFDMMDAPRIVARSGTIERWQLVNETDEVHAFHIHQVHFAVIDVDGSAANDRAWRDTVTVPPRHRTEGSLVAGTTTILVDFRDPAIRGEFVYHCHILDHEDGGMMAKIRVI